MVIAILLVIGTAIMVLLSLLKLKQIKQEKEIKIQTSAELNKLKSLMNFNKLTLQQKENLKKEIDSFKESIEKILNEVEENKINLQQLKSKTENINKKIDDYQSEVMNLFNEKDKVIMKAENLIDDFKSYLNANTFHPKEFLFDANRIVGKIKDLEDTKYSNLKKEINELDKEVNVFIEKLTNFKKLHREISEWLDTENSNQFSQQKEKMFFLLQNAQLNEAREILKSIKERTTQE